MKINEVEALAGITKKNIRFYEEQGLLAPRRSPDNGYRDYGEAEVETLRRIKLLRKLGMPIEEIRQILSGQQTLGDGLERHLVTLSRGKRSLEQSMVLCRQLQQQELPLDSLDAGAVLTQMEQLEREGTRFQNCQAGDIRRRYIPPVAAALIFGLLSLIMLYMVVRVYLQQPDMPFWFPLLMGGICLAIAGGVLAALVQRLDELRSGEESDAKRY